MKRRIMVIIFTSAMILTNINVAQASSKTTTYEAKDTVTATQAKDKSKKVYTNLPKYDGKDVVTIENDTKSDSRTIGLYEKKNGELVYTGHRVNQVKGKTMQLWKADEVNINGKTCWQIGDNLYFKSSRVSKINVDKTKQYGQVLTNFGNYPENNNVSQTDTINVNNTNGDSVPVMALQKDGSFTAIDNRTLVNNSSWITDTVRKYNGNIYCRVATNEWVNATAYVANK